MSRSRSSLRASASARSLDLERSGVPLGPAPGAAGQSWPSSKRKQKDLLVTNEFDRIYTTAGASGMNAGTTEDFTIYFINVPANKLELWFWMESDRLLNPVFREFYSERDVVARGAAACGSRARRPGKFDEQFEALFWTVVAVSLAGDRLAERPRGDHARGGARRTSASNYAPNNLTACLVGDFDPAEATALAQQVLRPDSQRNALSPPPVVHEEVAHACRAAHGRVRPRPIPQVEVRCLTRAGWPSPTNRR